MEITAFVVEDQRFKAVDVPSAAGIPADAVWIDAVELGVEEASDLLARFGLCLETDATFYEYDTYGHVEIDDQQLTVLLRTERSEGTSPSEFQSVKIELVMGQGKLVTIRSGVTPAVDRAVREVQNMKADGHPDAQILVHVLSRAIRATSARLDEAQAEVRRDASRLFGASSLARAELDLEQLLSELGPLQTRMVEVRYGHRIFTRLVDILRNDSRVALSPETRVEVDGLASEVVTLADFARSVDEQLTRLVDATMGYIGIRQNASARWFSIVATIFMPPTLLAAVWGMNFENMPELDEKYGYLIALGLLALSGSIPLWIVRKMGWAGH